MIYIDSNILIRIVTNDIPTLANQAIDMVDQCDDGTIIVTEGVMTEVCFILQYQKPYLLDHGTIYRHLLNLLDDSRFVVSQQMRDALQLFGSHNNLDFVDCMLAVLSDHKQRSIMTFDKALAAALK